MLGTRWKAEQMHGVSACVVLYMYIASILGISGKGQESCHRLSPWLHKGKRAHSLHRHIMAYHVGVYWRLREQTHCLHWLFLILSDGNCLKE